MNEHERDLLLGLVAGTLSPEEEAAAAELLAARPDLVDELALQRAALAALAELEAPTLRPEERATLRRSLREGLGLDLAVEGRPAPTSRWIRRLVPVLGFAAVLLAGFLVVAGGPFLGGGSSGSEFAVEEAAVATSTTSASVDALTATPPAADELTDLSAGDEIPEGASPTLATEEAARTRITGLDEGRRALELCRAAIEEVVADPVELRVVRAEASSIDVVAVAADGTETELSVDPETCRVTEE